MRMISLRRLPSGGALGDEGASARVGDHADVGDDPQCVVGRAVAAAVEPMPGGVSRRGLHRAGAAQGGQGRVPAQPAGVGSGARDTVTWPLRQLADAPAFLQSRLRSRADLLRFGRGLGGSALRLTAPSASSLNGPIGPHRRWASTTASLSRVKRIRVALGGTVNDILLAAIIRGFRDLLAERGELSEGLVVRSLVPISLRRQDERGVVTNRVSAVLANLPVGEPDPMRRLALLRGQMDDLKRTRQAVGAELLTQMLGFAAPTLLALGSRAAFQLPQPLVQTVTTHVPGPRFPLFVLGQQMVEAYPYVPIGDNVRISIAIFSYLDRFSFGITADYSAAPDLGVLVKGIRRGLAELQAQSSAARRAAAPARAKRPALARAKRPAAPARAKPHPKRRAVELAGLIATVENSGRTGARSEVPAAGRVCCGRSSRLSCGRLICGPVH
jgi:hypothetical protein